MCLLCLHHIRQQLNGKCPACRTPYSEENFVVIDKVDPEAAARELRERAEAKKAREKRDRAAAAERERAAAAAASQAKAKTTFKHVRVVQRNLVYVIGLSLSLAREEALKRTQMFGRFGRINRVLVNRGHPYNADAPGGPSIAAYILFARDTDASTAARVMNGEVFDGRELRCAIATTKYCDAFIRHGTLVLSCFFPLYSLGPCLCDCLRGVFCFPYMLVACVRGLFGVASNPFVFCPVGAAWRVYVHLSWFCVLQGPASTCVAMMTVRIYTSSPRTQRMCLPERRS